MKKTTKTTVRVANVAFILLAGVCTDRPDICYEFMHQHWSVARTMLEEHYAYVNAVEVRSIRKHSAHHLDASPVNP